MHTPLLFDGHTTTRWPGLITTRPWATRLLLLLGLWLAATTGAWAQASQYQFAPTTGAALEDMSTGTTSLVAASSDDGRSTVTPIGFSFTYAGTAYTSFSANVNGLLRLGATQVTTEYDNSSYGLGEGTNVPKLMPLFDDLHTGTTAGGGKVHYKLLGTSPNRKLVVEWFVTVPRSTTAAANSRFQLWLNETSNTFDFVYGAIPVNSPNSGASVGHATSATVYQSVTTSTNTMSNSTANNVNTVAIAAGMRYTFAPPAPCTAPPTAGTAVASVPSSCTSIATTTLSLTGSATGSGITYQWQQSATGTAGSFTNVSGTGTNATYTATNVTATTYYQAIVTCSGQSATTAPVAVTINSAIPAYASLPVTEGFESWISRCGNSEVPGSNWRNTPTTGDNSWRRNDQGHSTGGWRYINDEPAPYLVSSSQGSYSARFHSFGTAVNGTGSLDLFVDLSAAGTKTLTFDYINPTGTDKLEVLLSSDGGATFSTTPLLALGTASAFGGQSVTFAGTSATSVVRFRATSDFANDDIGFDNLRLQVTPACPGVAFSPTTNITSTGATINFAAVAGATSYTVAYSPGAGSQTVTSAGAVPLTGLQPYTVYTVTVTTNCGGGESGTATTSFRTAIGNDECSGAVALSVGAPGDACNAATYTTSGATASAVASPCTTIADGDVWFSFVATGVRHTITVVPTFDFDAVVELRSGNCPGASISCQDASASGGGAGTEALIAAGLTPGQTYLVRVYSALAGAGSGNFDICITTPPNLPCAQITNALVTNTGSTSTASTASLTFDLAAGATNYFLTLVPTAGGTTATATVTGSPVNLTGLTPNTSYTLTISTNCSNGAVSNPVAVVFTSQAAPVAPANDNCAGAISLSSAVTCTPVTGSTIGATASTAAGTCAGTADDDVWYSFVATNTSHTITVVGNSGFDAVVNLRSGACPGTSVGSCRDNTAGGGTETLAATGLTVGETYLVRVYSYSATAPTTTATGGFTICITEPAACAAPTALAAGSVTSTSASISFTAGNGNTSYTVTYTPQGGSALTATGSASPIALTGLTPSTQYSVTVTGNCSGGLTATSTAVTFTTLAPPPANDDCANATPIACGQTLTGTTVGATNTGEPTTACGGNTPSASPSVFYSFIGTGDIVTVSTCGAGTSIDTELFVYSGSCGALTCVGSNDDFAGCSANSSASQVTFTSVAGTQYYFMVQRYSSSSATGAFSLTLTCTPPPSCAAPTGVAAGSVTQTGASISFTASATATSYTVTATPTSGNPITVSGAASPLVLTGLSSSTTYSVTVTSNCAGGLTATSTPAVSFTTLTPPPANDECSSAIALTPGAAGATCSASNGSTIGATASTAAGTCAGTADDDVWYSFVATNTSHTITVVGNSGFDAVVNLRSGACPGTSVGSCRDNTAGGGTETLAATGLTVGETYLVRVYSYSATAPTTTATGGFTICVTTPAAPVCNAPTAAGTNSVTQTSANVTFTESASATSYTVTYTPQGGSALTATGSTSPIALTGLTPGTVYSVSIVSNCAGGLTSSAITTSFTTLAAATPDLTVSSAQNVQGTYNNVTITGTGTATLTGVLTVNGTLTVQTGGTLAQNCQVINGPGSFVLQAGAELRICDAAGIAATGGTGAIQLAGSRTFSNDANYVYNGTAPQAAGPGLPARVRNLTVNNATGLRLTQALNVAEVVRLTSGNLTLNSNALTLLSSAAGTALVDNTGGLVIGQATVQRYIDPSLNSGLGYRHYSSPVFSTTIADLTTAGFSPVVNGNYNTSATPLAVTPFPTVFSYEEARLATNQGAGLSDFDKGWTSPNSTGGPMAVGRGYTVNIAASALVDFVGSLNSGTISTLPLARGTQPDAGWHLVGNPYPSPLDWSTVSIPAGLNGAIYVHQSPSQYGTSYRSYQNGVGGNPLIASSQGFFVRTSTAGATPTLTLTNANRVTSFAQQVSFNRGPETRPLLQLAVRNTAGTSLDDTYVYFEQGATAGIDDRYDAYKLRNSSFNLSTLAGAEEMSINGLAPLTGAEVVVPLKLQVPQAGTYTFQAAQLLNFGTGAEVLLRDAQTGTLHNLSQQPSYTFTLNSSASDTRFSLVFRGTTALGTNNGLLATQVAVFPNPAHHSFQLTMPALVAGKSVKATLLNSLGQVITERTLPVTSTGVQAQFDVQHLAQGVYILRLETASGPVTKRVTVE